MRIFIILRTRNVRTSHFTYNCETKKGSAFLHLDQIVASLILFSFCHRVRNRNGSLFFKQYSKDKTRFNMITDRNRVMIVIYKSIRLISYLPLIFGITFVTEIGRILPFDYIGAFLIRGGEISSLASQGS